MHRFRPALILPLAALLAMLLVGTACDKGTPETTPAADRTAEVSSMPAPMPPSNPEDVLVSVNGAELTRGQAEQDVRCLKVFCVPGVFGRLQNGRPGLTIVCRLLNERVTVGCGRRVVSQSSLCDGSR